MSGPTRPVRALLGSAGLVAGLTAAAALMWGGYDVPPELAAPTLVMELAVGWSFIGIGLLAWSHRPDNRTGLLMVVLGFASFARFAVAVDSDVGFAVGVILGSVHLSVFVHLLVTFPTGRVGSWPAESGGHVLDQSDVRGLAGRLDERGRIHHHHQQALARKPLVLLAIARIAGTVPGPRCPGGRRGMSAEASDE